jgi:hypothetical protein
MAKSERIGEAQTRPKPNGEPGSIITFDPKQRSFKYSLIAIAFAEIYLDALLYIEGVKRLGKEAYKKIDRDHYEKKLIALGINDPNVIDSCKLFRKTRNELVHEKALEQTEIRAAQIEARRAINLIERITELLSDKP